MADTIIVSNNDVYNFLQDFDTNTSTIPIDELHVDPLFYSASTSDLRLVDDSLCKEAGTNIDPFPEAPLTLVDFENFAWPTIVDRAMGAYARTVVLPVNIVGWPKVVSVAIFSATFSTKTNVNGFAYFVVVPYNDPAPSSQQVKAGQDYTSTPVPAGFANATSLTANMESVFQPAVNLQTHTQYDVYVVAEDSLSHIQLAPTLLTFTTVSTSPPTNIWGYPKIDTIDETTTSFAVDIDQNGFEYFVVVPRGNLAPTSTQVKQGKNGSGEVVAAGFSGSVAMIANVVSGLAASNLSVGTSYDAYFVAENTFSNLQVRPVLLKFTTLPKIKDQTTIPKAYINSFVDINLLNLIVLTSKQYPQEFTLQVLEGNGYDIISNTSTSTKIQVTVKTSIDVALRVSDGENSSHIFFFKITNLGQSPSRTLPVAWTVLQRS
jgi:hypothetical protein